MGRRVKDFIEISEYTSLDQLINALTAIRDNLPADSDPELRMKGDDVFGRRLSISYFRELTEEEATVEGRYNGSDLPEANAEIEHLRHQLDDVDFERDDRVAKRRMVFTICFFIITMSSIAVPMTNGFVGEFLILLGTFKAESAFAYVAVSGVVLGAVYMLWMFKRVFFGEKGELVKDERHPLHDLSIREIAVMVPLIIMVFWMGLFPNNFLDYSKASVDHLVKNLNNYTLTVSQEANTNDLQASVEGEQ